MTMQGIPKGAAVAIADLLDHCAKIQAGQEVLLLAQLDGLYGGDNLADETAVSWIHSAIQHRGANASVLWIDEPARPHAWRLPPVVKSALTACDVLINHSFDIVFEEMVEINRTWTQLQHSCPCGCSAGHIHLSLLDALHGRHQNGHFSRRRYAGP